MRLGTSGVGVIAVVSLLVTAAAPETDDAVRGKRESSIDHSSAVSAPRISSEGYPRPSRVTTETGGASVPGSFVKIEFERFGSSSPEASRSPSHRRSSLVRRVRNTDGSTETPTAALPRLTSSRVLPEARNLASAATAPPDVRSTTSGRSLRSAFEDSEILRASSTGPGLVYSATREFAEKFFVAVDPRLSNPIVESPIGLFPRVGSTGERERIRERGETEDRNNCDDKRSTWSSMEELRKRRARSSGAKSAGTMNRQLTTTATTTTSTTTRRSFMDKDFRNPTERYQAGIVRGTRESSKNKANQGEARFANGEPEVNGTPITTARVMSGDAEERTHSDSLYLPNYSAQPGPTARSAIQDGVDRTIAESTDRSIGESSTKSDRSIGESSTKSDDAPREERLAGDEAKSVNETASRGRETVVDSPSSVTEEISRSRQVTSESTLDVPILVGHDSLSVNLADASLTVDPVEHEATSLDNHRAFGVPTFQAPRSEQQQQHRQRASTLESPAPARPHDAVGKNGSAERRPVLPVNRIAVPKTAYPVGKNHSKSSISLVDGRANKIFYEIKPSLITEMDSGEGVEVTATPRRIFERFFIPSVPSAFGKFGPYFLDEEDRRNVTERIGGTVQLDCRIGLLGHRKVTWLQHYKDSFRLLTVERESYSVDRRISLNFQYPDNWRLQIAYASLRDSGLYKCQVEIDQDRSLVKRYNVIITAPVLTITDDSGRPISGERHLKAGSALKLRCEARDVLQRLNESVLWMRGDETLTEDVSENKTTEVATEKDITVVVSTLLVERATPRHAGNYSCVVPDKARNTIAVHVLNGELPAAVQHGSGVATAVLNLWLIHLTASYGFFR